MESLASRRHSVLPVLYVGDDLTRARDECLRAHRIGLVRAENTARARRSLSHFRVAVIVFALPDLQGAMTLARNGVPLILLAARGAACEDEAITVLPRDIDAEELAAVIHGVIRRAPSATVARDAA